MSLIHCTPFVVAQCSFRPVDNGKAATQLLTQPIFKRSEKTTRIGYLRKNNTGTILYIRYLIISMNVKIKKLKKIYLPYNYQRKKNLFYFFK